MNMNQICPNPKVEVVHENDNFPRECFYEKYSSIAEYLRQRGVITEEDRGNKIRFSFVGIVIAKGFIIRCLPKFSTEVKDLEKVLKTLWKLAAHSKKKSFYGHDYYQAEEENEDYLFLLRSLVYDYLENGIYRDEHVVTEQSCLGAIDWDKSISEKIAYIQNDRPVYVDLFSKHSQDDPNNFFTKLHQSILTQIYRDFQSLDLLKVLNIPNLIFGDVIDLEEFGSIKELETYIKKEISISFENRKIYLLNLFLSYLKYWELGAKFGDITILGTSSFDNVWEELCRNVFQVSVGKDTYKERMQAAEWSDNTGKLIKQSRKMNPDIVIRENFQNKNYLIIADAKYYLIGSEFNNIPGVEDIVKQHVYEMFFVSSDDCRVNCLLFPTSEKKPQFLGTVKIPIFKDYLSNSIKVLALPIQEMLDCYLTNQRKSLMELLFNFECINNIR